MKYLHLIVLFLLCECAWAQTPKTNYNLFNPVPQNKLRDLETDRPDVTESPITVDAGHFQVESDLFKRIVSKSEKTQFIEHQYNVANLKLGLTYNTDLQLIIGSYINSYELTDLKEKTNNKTAFGDIVLRLKHNVWGNNSGKTALSIMPYVKFPTCKIYDNNHLEAGFVIPFGLELNKTFNLGTQAQFDLLKTDSKNYQSEILQSVVLGIEITEKFSSFIESYYTYNFSDKKAEVFYNSGISYKLLNNLKIDTGFNLGLTKNSDNVYFIGFSFRY